MDWEHALYWSCLIAGLLYTVVTLTLGGAVRGPLRPWSLPVLAFWLAAFGASSLYLAGAREPEMRALALPFGLLVGSLLAWGYLLLANRIIAEPLPPAEESPAPPADAE
jgi:hypothetical protein